MIIFLNSWALQKEILMYYYDENMRLMLWNSAADLTSISVFQHIELVREYISFNHTIIYDEGWD